MLLQKASVEHAEAIAEAVVEQQRENPNNDGADDAILIDDESGGGGLHMPTRRTAAEQEHFRTVVSQSGAYTTIGEWKQSSDYAVWRKNFSITQYKEALEKHAECFSSSITERQRMNVEWMPSTTGAWFNDKTARLLAAVMGCTSYTATWNSYEVVAYLANGRSESVKVSDVRLAEKDMIFIFNMDERHYYGLNRGGRRKGKGGGAKKMS